MELYPLTCLLTQSLLCERGCERGEWVAVTCSPDRTFPGTGDAGNCWQVDCRADNNDSLASGIQSFLEQFPLTLDKIHA